MRPLYLITAVALTLAAAPQSAHAADVTGAASVTPVPALTPSATPAPEASAPAPALEPSSPVAPALPTPTGVAPDNTDKNASQVNQANPLLSSVTQTGGESGTAKSDVKQDARTNVADKASLPEAELLFPKPNQGHFIALGAYGVGAMAFDKGRGTRQPTLGQGFSLRFGEAVTDWLDLGLFFALGTTHGNAADKLLMGRFGLHSQWYVSSRWFVQLGFGATNGQGADPEDLKKVRGRFGDVYLTGVGTHLYLSDSDKSGGWVLTPVATVEVGPDSRFTTTALWLGLEVSWWSGLSRDKLKLPISKAYATGRR